MSGQERESDPSKIIYSFIAGAARDVEDSHYYRGRCERRKRLDTREVALDHLVYQKAMFVTERTVLPSENTRAEKAWAASPHALFKPHYHEVLHNARKMKCSSVYADLFPGARRCQ